MKLIDIINEEGPSEKYKNKQVKKVKNVYAALKTGFITVEYYYEYDNKTVTKYKYVLNNDYQLGIGTDHTIVFVKMDPIKYQLYKMIDGNEWHVDKNQGSNISIYEKAWKEISNKFKNFDLILR
jgi:hypothetical protein